MDTGEVWDSLQGRNGIQGPFPILGTSSKALQKDKCEEQAIMPLRRHPVPHGCADPGKMTNHS